MSLTSSDNCQAKLWYRCFLNAIKTLKLPRMPKTHALKELQIGLVKGEAIFCMEGAQTRCPATREWNGFGLDVAVCLRGWESGDTCLQELFARLKSCVTRKKMNIFCKKSIWMHNTPYVD